MSCGESPGCRWRQAAAVVQKENCRGLRSTRPEKWLAQPAAAHLPNDASAYRIKNNEDRVFARDASSPRLPAEPDFPKDRKNHCCRASLLV